MHSARVILDGTDAPVAQSDSWMSLYRRESSEKPRRKRDYKLLQRQEEDEAEDEEESESDSENSDGEDSSAEDGESSTSLSEGSGDEEELTRSQQQLQQSSPFADFELPTVPDLGALPMPTLNTRRSMQLDKIRRRPRGTPSRRQEPPPPPPPELSSESGEESDGIASEFEPEDAKSSGNPPPDLRLGRPRPRPRPPRPGADAPRPLPPPVSEEPPTQTTASSSSSTSATTSSSSSGSSTGTITTGPFPTDSSISLGQSTFIAAADPTSSSSSVPTTSPQQQRGPPPESQTAMISGVTILGIAIIVTLIFLLFRYCLPVRTWYTTRLQKHRDDKAARLGTAPSPWKWPLQFIFGSDHPAPPRRQQQQQQEYYKTPTSYASNNDLEAQSAPGLVADGFRPPQASSANNNNSSAHPAEYKSDTTASGAGSWVANGWRAPLSQISQRLSNRPRRSGTARWFFGGGASRWSDSDAGTGGDDNSNPRTTASSEGQIVDMFGAPTPRSVARRGSIEKSPVQVQVSQVSRESAASPPLPDYRPSVATTASPHIVTTTIIKPPPRAAAAGLGLTTTQSHHPVRPRASPRTSYLRSSVATTATSGTGITSLEPPSALPFVGFNGFSHFSASTIGPATPPMVGMGLPKGPKPVAGTRFPVRTGSVSSMSSAGSRGSVNMNREKPLPVPLRGVD